jgi:spore coat protein SA
MKKPNVAIVTPGTFSIPSHRSSSVERVVMNVSNLLKHEVNFSIYGKKVKGLPDEQRKDGIHYIRPYYRTRLQYLNKVSQRIRKQKSSIIQVENRPRFARYLKRKFRKRQVWLCLHSTKFISQPHITDKELRSCLGYADKIIVNSGFLREKLLMMAPLMRHKIIVNYLGVDPRQFIPQWSETGKRLKAELMTRLGYEHKRIILYVGRLIETKGIHHLLKVMPAIIRHDPNVILVIVGSAQYGRNKITPYVAKLHQMGNALPHNVRFIPFVNYNEIQKWFSLADVAVVPSFEEEAFGLVNVEAMASGVPVIATKSGGMKEIIEHEKTGLLIHPEILQEELIAGITDLLFNQEKCRMMGEASIERVRNHFTWQHTANRFLSYYIENS